MHGDSKEESQEEMMDEIALWGTARKMRELYGMFAAATAVQRAKMAHRKGDLAKFRRWTRIAEILSAPWAAMDTSAKNN